MDDHKLSKQDYLHFIPAGIILINILPYLFKGFDYKLTYAINVIENPINLIKFNHLYISPSWIFLFRPLHSLFYVILSIGLIYKNKLNFSEKNNQPILIFKWLWMLIGLALVLYFSFFLFSFIGFITQDYHLASIQAFYVLLSTTISLILLNFSLLFFPNILYGLPQLDYRLSTFKEIGKIEEKRMSKNFEISEDKLQLLKNKIDEYLVSMPYLNPNFNLTMLSSDTDIPVHHLSYFFNEYMRINFNTWKNDLKIAYVIELMKKGTYENLTLDALSKKAGFGSRSSFINHFKAKTGLTPSEYLQNIE